METKTIIVEAAQYRETLDLLAKLIGDFSTLKGYILGFSIGKGGGIPPEIVAILSQDIRIQSIPPKKEL